ncbi:MAG: hypothetical protein IT319_05095 [Anaerolineae bacterium]|nr:hypothetical protein [Anaerolineae bacterium]
MNFLMSNPRSSSQGNGRAAVIGGDEVALREFLAQTTGAHGLMGDTTVYVGQLPPAELDAPIPLPPDAQIVGSIVRGTTSIEILLTVKTSVEQTNAACEQLLLARDWQPVEEIPMGARGFVDSPVVMRRYCHQGAKAAVMVSISKADADITMLRFNLSHEPNPCQPRTMMHVDIFKYMPNLQTPSGARLILGRSGSGGGGGSPGARSVSSTAVLVTDLPVAQVAQAYIDQLNALDWQPVSAEIGERFAAGAWITTQDESRWSAFFTLAADPIQPDEYQLWLYLSERAE